eukprot:2820728-Alexandrium_andersonii.AAC.1
MPTASGGICAAHARHSARSTRTNSPHATTALSFMLIWSNRASAFAHTLAATMVNDQKLFVRLRRA